MDCRRAVGGPSRSHDADPSFSETAGYQMKKSTKPKPQKRRFIEAAREAGASEDEADFDRGLRGGSRRQRPNPCLPGSETRNAGRCGRNLSPSLRGNAAFLKQPSCERTRGTSSCAPSERSIVTVSAARSGASCGSSRVRAPRRNASRRPSWMIRYADAAFGPCVQVSLRGPCDE